MNMLRFPILLFASVLCWMAGAAEGTEEVEKVFPSWLSVNAFADIQSAYWARGVIVDKHPFSAQCLDLSLVDETYGKLEGYAWSVSSLSRRGQGACRRNAYNEVDYGICYAKVFMFSDAWGLGGSVGPKWVTLPGYHPHANTIHEWNVSQWLENPYVTPYYLMRYAYSGQKWCYWDVGLRRSFSVCDRLTFSASAFCEFGDARHFAAQYGTNANRRSGDFSSGLMALNLMLRLDYAITDSFGVYAYYHQFDCVSDDARTTLSRSSAPEAKRDLAIFSVGMSVSF